MLGYKRVRRLHRRHAYGAYGAYLRMRSAKERRPAPGPPQPQAVVGPSELPPDVFDNMRAQIKATGFYIPHLVDGREQLTVTMLFVRAYTEGEAVWLSPCGQCGGDRGTCACDRCLKCGTRECKDSGVGNGPCPEDK